MCVHDWTKYVGVYDYVISYWYISLDFCLTNAIKIYNISRLYKCYKN